MDLLSLHYQDDRHAKFKAGAEPFFNQELKSWIIFKPELTVELLRDERLIVPEVVGSIRMLETRYKRQFPNLLFAARCIPLLLEGQDHREIRRKLAELVTGGRARVTAALPSLMARHIEPLDAAPNPDWVADGFIPLIGDVFRYMCDCPQPLPFPKLVLTRLFDRFVSLAALIDAERRIDELRETLTTSAPHVDPGLAVPLLILGRDSLVGTLATSLDTILRQNPNRRYAEIAFPDFPPETGVAIAERIATAPIAIGSHNIAAGDKVRMYFQPMMSPESTVNKQNLFGSGPHSCLGRPISLDVWRIMIDTFRRFASIPRNIACEFEPNNIFVVPRYLKIEHARE